MIQVPLVDELREVRRKLVEQCNNDPRQYADMLRQVAELLPGHYVDQPVVSEGPEPINTQTER